MNKEEMLKRLKDIHLLYSMPMMAQNMRPEHYAIVEYEKLAYEQQAIITQLTNNWNELEKWVKEYMRKNEKWYTNELSTYDKQYYGDTYYTTNAVLMTILDKMKEIKGGNKE